METTNWNGTLSFRENGKGDIRRLDVSLKTLEPAKIIYRSQEDAESYMRLSDDNWVNVAVRGANKYSWRKIMPRGEFEKAYLPRGYVLLSHKEAGNKDNLNIGMPSFLYD